jgi:K+-sensing histidine kinase KdpD
MSARELREHDLAAATATTATDDLFDRIAGLAAAVSDCPIALVSLVERGQQRFQGVIGLDVSETPHAALFCARAARTGRILVVENVLADERRRDHQALAFYAGARLCASNGVAFGMVCVLDRRPRHLSPRQKEALSMLARELEVQLSLRQLLAGAERSSDQKHQVATMIAHDMRSPLQVGLAHAYALTSRHATTPESRESLAHLTNALKTLQRMTTNLLDVCTSTTGALYTACSAVELSALITEITDYARAICGSERRVEVATQLGVPVVHTDRELVRRILENLISNALKYAPRGSTVRLDMSSDADCLSFRVIDDGPGVPESEREAIFDERFRLSRDADLHSRTSYGLGLTFCRLAVDALSGRIWVEDAAHTGAMFCVELPCRASEPTVTVRQRYRTGAWRRVDQ